MLKCEVHLNDEKILADGLYTPEEVHKTVDNMFEEFELVKGENGFYYGKGSDKDFAHFWCVILRLKDSDWFMDYVEKWLWYESNEANYTPDDLKKFYLEQRVKKGA